MPAQLGEWAQSVYKAKYAWPNENWQDTAHRVAHNVLKDTYPDLIDDVTSLIARRKFIPGGRYLYAAGRPYHQVQNCLLLDVEDSRESWADLNQRVTNGLMTGAGVGVVYSKLRENGAHVRGLGGKSTGPLALTNMINEIGRYVMQGGSRRSAIWAGIHWNHPDAPAYITAKDWPEHLAEAKRNDFNAAAPLDMTNVSIILDDDFFIAYEQGDALAHQIYHDAVQHMLETGEPGFSIDVGKNAGEHLRNACTEITSADNDDICNLGSIVLPNIEDQSELAYVTELATAFLVAGTIYSKVPYDAVAKTREKNRRLGLGVMGFAEWLSVRGKPYGPDAELGEWLSVYESESDHAAVRYAHRAGVSVPVKSRAIAPTGTISIIAETTSGIEPVFASAYQRRWLDGGTNWKTEYIIDASAKRLVEQGVDPQFIDSQDAMAMSQDPGRRLAFQAFVQQYVDHGISSTLNLPAYGNQSFTTDEFANTLYYYLPKLRGVTTYPDGARGGQPLTPVPLDLALEKTGGYAENGNENACVGGSCGI